MAKAQNTGTWTRLGGAAATVVAFVFLIRLLGGQNVAGMDETMFNLVLFIVFAATAVVLFIVGFRQYRSAQRQSEGKSDH